MQERYLGDVHDFMKYALLRHLNRKLDISIGLNWYLTDPARIDKPSNVDGNQRYHMNGGVFYEIDAELVEALNHFNDDTNRKLSDFERTGILPANTTYYEAEVPASGRAGWHKSAMEHLQDRDLIFMDPDNGFVVPSVTRGRLPKYALYEEAIDYLDADKIVLCIQFARQCDPIQRALDVRAQLKEKAGIQAELPVVRCRVSPNILFLFLAREDHHPSLIGALESFGDPGRKKVQLIIQ